MAAGRVQDCAVESGGFRTARELTDDISLESGWLSQPPWCFHGLDRPWPGADCAAINVTLPSDLLLAVSAPGGGKITLVVGAGCSFEAPTSIPLSATLSEESHRRLVADGVLATGDCPTPSNLSCLADAVVKKTGQQGPLVEQLNQHYSLKTATPNEGHLFAAALLAEGVIASVITLNFDLALSIAIGQLGVGDTVGIIDGPSDFPKQKTINLYYLHRNVTADPEEWILRTEALKSEWKGSWEGIVAQRVLSAPVVIFAGLGSPADVLIESTEHIRKAIPDQTNAYQVDPGDREESEFFKALDLGPSAFVRQTWCEFMAALSQRLVVEHMNQLNAAASTIVLREGLLAEDLTGLLNSLERIGLVGLGQLRANWLLDDKTYYPDEPLARELVADLLLGAALVSRVTGAIAVLFEDGIVEFRRGDRTVSSHVFVSGRGTRSQIAIETELSMRHRRFRRRATPPTGAIIAATRQTDAPVTTPADVLLGDMSESIVRGQPPLPIFHVESLRQDPAQPRLVAP
jgi:hypothetical protein